MCPCAGREGPARVRPRRTSGHSAWGDARKSDDRRRPCQTLGRIPGTTRSPLDLVGRLRGAEQKSVGEGSHPPYIKALSITRAQALPTTPRPEYPRPRLHRRQWASLNGTWQFGFDAPDFDRSIIVPFAYQSALSGIGERALHDTVWYRRRFTRPDTDRLILHFGAVDYAATVWVNDVRSEEHTSELQSRGHLVC